MNSLFLPYTTRTFFEAAADMGYPATALWWPAMFPARPQVPVMTLPGLGAPDIRGQLGVGAFFSSTEEKKEKTTVVKLVLSGKDQYQADLPGPQTQGREGPRTISLPIKVEVLDPSNLRMTLGDQQVEMRLNEWSEIIELRFKASMFMNIYAITRFIPVSLRDAVRIYALPLQIHPLHSTWHYSSSSSFAKRLWKDVGPYLTLGWPQDTTGLEEGCISDDQFLDLCQKIFERRIQILYCLMDEFREGVLASIFDDLDRIQHMFFHNRMDVVQDWYRRLDRFVGEVSGRVEKWSGKYSYLILSDHGFSDYRKKVHLNRWLLENGYLRLTEGGSSLAGVDWSQTTAYAVGLNSIYLNIAGPRRTGDCFCRAGGEFTGRAQKQTSGLERFRSELYYPKDASQARNVFRRLYTLRPGPCCWVRARIPSLP